MRRAVLGIDAAWTAAQPSGVALAVEVNGRWTLCAVAASYLGFLAPPIGGAPYVKSSGSPIDAGTLLAAAAARTGIEVDLVAVDMPLAHSPIRARRTSDDAVSRRYGAKWCSTHTPSATRPGPVGEALMRGFVAEGLSLATQKVSGRSLVEVYPHPALVELTKADKRLPYKAQKARGYWPELTPEQRRCALLSTWDDIVARLDERIVGTRALLPSIQPGDRGGKLKAFEDMLDAVVCAWVGTAILADCASPYGDADSAIWIPNEGA